ncbi:hypothetical protein DFJ67_3156 [Asanoa ferruginea]|uniref:Uncharacterized protein n=1 Tax=Asanoa ferruginea TaxID=53367 RepID=A0A3D9ZJY6_9ACTN|nr:hypothetical protein [Asanoa ferruginea]REF97159.1 hypothetical protein DFJ67_3156 [Asanoa ferruginea]GIF50109.1 hypothetical protein Afe04nite_46480 [Asanoa ferruginea]
MSRDVIVLVPQMPDVAAVTRALEALGPDLLVDAAGDAGLTRICAPSGRPLLVIEEPIMVAVPGEVARLLDVEVAGRVSTPVWWLELRASGPDTVDLVYRFADAVVEHLGGTHWPPR